MNKFTSMHRRGFHLNVDEEKEQMRSRATDTSAPRVTVLLHPLTARLVERFALALSEKLAAAERKRGVSTEWAKSDWMDECREQLARHIEEGDPLDVAAYCAFLWHHGEPTSSASAPHTDIAPAYALPSVDALAQVIRTVDGNHSLGAGALAEKIVEHIARAATLGSQEGTDA